MPIAKETRRHRKGVGRRSAPPRRKMKLMTHAERVDALCGKHAFVRTSSQEFISRKAAEMEREDRKCRPS